MELSFATPRCSCGWTASKGVVVNFSQCSVCDIFVSFNCPSCDARVDLVPSCLHYRPYIPAKIKVVNRAKITGPTLLCQCVNKNKCLPWMIQSLTDSTKVWLCETAIKAAMKPST